MIIRKSNLRLLRAAPLALLAALAIFWCLHILVMPGAYDPSQVESYTMVQIVEPKQPEPEPEKPVEELPEEPLEEMPELPSMDIDMPDTPTAPLATMDSPAFDLAVGDLSFGGGGSGDFYMPGKGNGEGDGDGDGKKGKKGGGDGYKEVIPVSTRQPDIPLAAWQNKINGWVMVAITISAPDGKVTNVRVLKSSPAGVFDAKVVEAVRDWLYDMADRDKSLTVTQKIDLYWKDYPNNIVQPGM